MNNETNNNPNVETGQVTAPSTTEQVPVIPEQAVAEATITPAAPEMVAQVPAAPEMVAQVPAAPETVAQVPATPEMAQTVPAAPAPTVQQEQVIPESAPVAASPAIIESTPEVVEQIPAAQPVPNVAPAAQPVPNVAPATPVEASAQNSLPQVEIPNETVSMPTIETQPPKEVASNNFADFQMPETPASTPPAEPVPETSPTTTGEIVGENKKGNKTLFIILAAVIGVIVIVGAVGFFLTRGSNKENNNNKPQSTAKPTSSSEEEIVCTFDNTVDTIDEHSEATIKYDASGIVRVDYIHTYSASDKSALNERHLGAIEVCKQQGAETGLGKDTRCKLKEGKIIVTAYLEGKQGQTIEDWKQAISEQKYNCK